METPTLFYTERDKEMMCWKMHVLLNLHTYHAGMSFRPVQSVGAASLCNSCSILSFVRPPHILQSFHGELRGLMGAVLLFAVFAVPTAATRVVVLCSRISALQGLYIVMKAYSQSVQIPDYYAIRFQAPEYSRSLSLNSLVVSYLESSGLHHNTSVMRYLHRLAFILAHSPRPHGLYCGLQELQAWMYSTEGLDLSKTDSERMAQQDALAEPFWLLLFLFLLLCRYGSNNDNNNH